MPEKEKQKQERQINLKLTEDEYQALQKVAEQTGKTYRDLVCESMELRGRLELAPPIAHHGKGGLLGITNDQVSEFVFDALVASKSFFLGAQPVEAAKKISAIAKWDDLTDADKLSLLMYLKNEEDSERVGRDLERIAGFLEAEPTEVKAFYRRIVKTGERSFDLKE